MSTDVLPPRTGLKDLEAAPRVELRDDGRRTGLSTVIPAGAYRGTVAWPSSCEIFLKGLHAYLKAHPEMRRNSSVKYPGKDVIKLDTFMAGVEKLAEAASRGGRDVQVSNRTIAEALGCALKTVQRIARIASRVVQCLVDIINGRELTKEERFYVWRQIPIRGHRVKQRGVPPVRAFHVPPGLLPFVLAAAIEAPPVDNSGSRHTPSDLQGRSSAPLPRRGRVPETTNLATTPPSEPTSSKRGSLRSPNGPGSARTAWIKKRRARPARELAADLVKEVPWLRSEAIRRLENALKRFAESRPVWTAQDLHSEIQTIRERRGLGTALTDDQIRTRPAVVLAAFLRELDPHDDHPRLAEVEPAELRCGRTECDHGWISDVGRDQVRRCDQCRPGAWPEPTYEELTASSPWLDDDAVDVDDEVPF